MPAARQGFQARNELLRRGAAPVEQREEQTEMGKNVEPGSATGGEGWRVRAHILDSESGGAKGRYPK